MNRRSAARPKWSSSARVTKYRMCRSSIASRMVYSYAESIKISRIIYFTKLNPLPSITNYEDDFHPSATAKATNKAG